MKALAYFKWWWRGFRAQPKTELKAMLAHQHWKLKQAGLYAFLFRFRLVRKKFRRAEWNHWLGCHYSKAMHFDRLDMR